MRISKLAVFPAIVFVLVACGSSSSGGSTGAVQDAKASDAAADGAIADTAGADVSGSDSALADTAKPDTLAASDMGKDGMDGMGKDGMDGMGKDGMGKDGMGGDGMGGDGTMKPDTSNSCGNVDELGVCKGLVIEWCDGDELQSYDCAEGLDDPADVACKKISDDWGFDCSYADGVSCIYESDVGVGFGFCGGAKAACALGPDDGVCTPGVGTCTEDDIETCMGDHALIDCLEGQPATFDCKAFGGTCSLVDGSAACVGVPAEGSCDGEMLQCKQGLSCKGASDESWGTCE